MRLDRLATLYLMHPLQKRYPQRRLQIPILMYHSISDEPEGGLHPYYRTATRPERFAEHLRALLVGGYQSLSLEEASRRLQDPALSLQRSVVITFDDGYMDFMDHAFPHLMQFGFTATVFLPTAYIGDATRNFKGKQCLTWGQVQELHRSGICFGSHTVTHPRLDTLSGQELEFEIAGSKSAIEDKLGCAINCFAYPYAFPEPKTAFKHQLRDLLWNTGYRYGVCTNIGTEDGQVDRLFMRRLPINSCDDPELFAAKLDGAYDWLGVPQDLTKRVKGWLSPAAGTR